MFFAARKLTGDASKKSNSLFIICVLNYSDAAKLRKNYYYLVMWRIFFNFAALIIKGET
jgi:hypothetical protein